MPSGAKKRKAAKKKKENQNQSNNSSHGDEGVKHHDDRESDVGEVSSPTSEDHQKLPIEGGDEEIEKDSGVAGPSPAEGSRFENDKEQVGVEESVVQVKKEFKIEDELVVKDGIIGHDEANRKSYDGDSSGSSGGSSSSDDESHGVKKGQAESSIAPVESAEVADSFSGKLVESVCDSPTSAAGDSRVENISAANSEKITLLSKQVEFDVLSPADIPVAPYVVGSTREENGGKIFISVCTSKPSVNAASQGKEEANLQSAESTPTTSDPKEFVAQENNDKSTSPYIAPRAPVDDGAQHMKDHVVTQPVVAPFPYPVQKTSWKSCCGLFEVFSGSAA